MQSFLRFEEVTADLGAPSLMALALEINTGKDIFCAQRKRQQHCGYAKVITAQRCQFFFFIGITLRLRSKMHSIDRRYLI